MLACHRGWFMEVDDFEGHATIDTEAELDRRLRRVRKGDYGAFILSHGMKGSSLWIHVFKDIAYLHYFPDGDGKHPGYQATGMQPANCDEQVKFLMVGDSIEMPRDTLVTLETAYLAASEYLHDSGLPPSVSWSEL